MALKTGMKFSLTEEVTEDRLATIVRSGAMRVFATPCMLAFIEHTCADGIQKELQEGQTTVGIGIDLKHLASTPKGLTVRSECELVAIDRRKLTFKCKVYDPFELIGEGTHERFIIDKERFQAKADSKLTRKVEGE